MGPPLHWVGIVLHSVSDAVHGLDDLPAGEDLRDLLPQVLDVGVDGTVISPQFSAIMCYNAPLHIFRLLTTNIHRKDMEMKILDRIRASGPLSMLIFITAISIASPALALKFGMPSDVDRLPDGSTLVTDSAMFGPSQIVLLGPDREVLWAIGEGLDFPHNADLQDNGNLIISDTGNDRVIELDPNFDVVWNSDFIAFSDSWHLDYPNDVNILEGDTILITDRDNHRVIETDRQGNILWQFGVTRQRGSDDTHLNGPHNADRLDNGNTIIADSNNRRILEISPEGEIVWRYQGGLNWPRDADRLENGNTLITDSRNNRVIEVNLADEIVWQYTFTGFQAWPYDADRLENGNTLMGDMIRSRVIEVTPDYEIVWAYPCSDCTIFGLHASYEAGTVSLKYEIGTAGTTTWANYLVLTSPSVQVVPLWTISLQKIEPSVFIPVAFPLPGVGWIGIYSGLYSGEGEEAVKFVWIDTGWD